MLPTLADGGALGGRSATGAGQSGAMTARKRRCVGQLGDPMAREMSNSGTKLAGK